MKFEDSPFSQKFDYYKLEMPFGNFFLCEKFIVSELHEGIHFDWNKLLQAAKEVLTFYNKGTKLGYISNRINSYSMDPQSWLKIEEFQKKELILGCAIVFYNQNTFLNVSLENMFADLNIRPCKSLDEALEWMMKQDGAS